MWKFPGSLLWVPTAVNTFLLAEVVQLAWERASGVTNTAQGDLEIAAHIVLASVPIACCLLVGWCVLAVIRTQIPRDPESRRETGCIVLAVLNLIAPMVLLLVLRRAT